MASRDSIIRNLLSRGESVSDIQEPWWSKQYGKVIQAAGDSYDRAKMYTGNQLDESYTALTTLLNSADTEEGMELFNKRLSEFSSNSLKFGGFDDSIAQADSLKLLGKQKKQKHTDFSIGIQQASDFIDSDKYLSKQSDFENLPSTVDALNAKRKANNENPYEGTLDYLMKEKDRTLSLMDKIMPGMQFNKDGMIVGTNIRYNRANNNDKDATRKIVQYYNRIELAAKTLAGDGIITPDEAKAIFVGDMDDYIKTRDIALAREQGNYKDSRNKFARFSGYVNMARQKALKSLGDNYLPMATDYGEDSSEYKVLGDELNILTGLGEDATDDDWKSIISSLEQQRDGYKTLMNTSNTKYKYWSGDYYEAGGEADDKFMNAELAKQMGITTDKYMELQKNASDRGMTIDEYMVAEKEASKKEPDYSGETEEDMEKLKAELTAPFEEEKIRNVKLYAEEPRVEEEPPVKVEMNNPGNLRFADQKDATGKTAAGFATFDSPDAGFQALYNQIDLDKTKDFTLEEFTNKYAPPSENDTAAYIKSLQQQLKVDKSTKITDINTKKLANAIAKQEGWKGDFPDVEPKKAKKIKDTGAQLTEVRNGKRVVNYDVANTHSFKQQQVNLQNISSNKFKSLSKDDKKKYGNARNFVKAKYTEWLKKTGKYGKGAWYSEGDFEYFIPTKVGPKGTITNIPDVDTYDLFDRRINKHPAFRKVKGLPAGTTSSSYGNFAKDFDDFRKFLAGA